jgi:hypothetical protein
VRLAEREMMRWGGWCGSTVCGLGGPQRLVGGEVYVRGLPKSSPKTTALCTFDSASDRLTSHSSPHQLDTTNPTIHPAPTLHVVWCLLDHHRPTKGTDCRWKFSHSGWQLLGVMHLHSAMPAA